MKKLWNSIRKNEAKLKEEYKLASLAIDVFILTICFACLLSIILNNWGAFFIQLFMGGFATYTLVVADIICTAIIRGNYEKK